VAVIRNVSVLNHTIGKLLRQQLSVDTRNIATFLLMIIGILASQSVHLSAWILWVLPSTKAGSRVRRFARWLENTSIDPHAWYVPIFLYAMREWTKMPIFIALDTSMLYDQFCCVRISMIYMNRAIPVAWSVLKHDSSSVKYERYSHLFARVEKLLPKEAEKIF
jgi:hypothetical protein